MSDLERLTVDIDDHAFDEVDYALYQMDASITDLDDFAIHTI